MVRSMRDARVWSGEESDLYEWTIRSQVLRVSVDTLRPMDAVQRLNGSGFSLRQIPV